MPAVVLVTGPLRVLPLFPVRATAGRSKMAVTVVAAVSVTVQEPVPEQPPPLQPAKVEPVAGVAVRGSAGPAGERGRGDGPHRVSPRAVVTLPAPVPPLGPGGREGLLRKVAGVA